MAEEGKNRNRRRRRRRRKSKERKIVEEAKKNSKKTKKRMAPSEFKTNSEEIIHLLECDTSLRDHGSIFLTRSGDDCPPNPCRALRNGLASIYSMPLSKWARSHSRVLRSSTPCIVELSSHSTVCHLSFRIHLGAHTRERRNWWKKNLEFHYYRIQQSWNVSSIFISIFCPKQNGKFYISEY